MTSEEPHFTHSRVPDPGVRSLVAAPNRWQRWLDVEAALALAQAELGIIPADAASAIAAAARLDSLDLAAVRARMETMTHPLMPLIVELGEAAGEQHGRWVHWGATSQNVMQTGDLLMLREAHEVLLRLLADVLSAVADLAERGADVVMAGRTHGQHAVPITFGFKAATWIDQLVRHLTRLRRVEPDLFVAMMGGAVGTYASIGPAGPELQARVAERLGLGSMAVPARSISDTFGEYVCLLGLLAATGGTIAREVRTLMKTEYGEVSEPTPAGNVGSSTMPHKRNPQLADHAIALAARTRALVPSALESMQQDHEADSGCTELMGVVVVDACILTGDLLSYLAVVLGGLELDECRMRDNLGLTAGLISSEAVMLALGGKIGRQHAHEVVRRAARAADSGVSFADVLAADPGIASHLSTRELRELTDPAHHVGLAATIALRAAERARQAVKDSAAGA